MKFARGIVSMKIHMSQKKIFLSIIFIVAIVCCFSGCATHSLNMKIEPNYYATAPWQEVNDKKSRSDRYRQFTGYYTGGEIVGKQSYARILLRDSDNVCREKNSIELLIPVGAGSGVVPIIRDASPNQSNSLYPSKKVNIIAINHTGQRTEPKYILPKEKWKGYPSDILLTDDGEYQKERVIKVAYHNGPEDDDIIFSSADTSNLGWVCRKKEENKMGYYFLYPFAIAFDIITSPIQIPAFFVLMNALDYKPDRHNRINSIAFSPDGKYILASDNKILMMWDISSEKAIKTFNSSTRLIVFSPDGRYFLTIHGYEIVLWDITSDSSLRTFKVYDNHIWFAAFSPDGKYVLSGGSDLIIWETQTGKHIQTFLSSTQPEEIHDVTFTDDGKFIFTGGHFLRKWDWKSGKEIIDYRWQHMNGGGFRAFSPNGKYFFIGANDSKSFVLYDTLTKKELRIFPVCSDYIIYNLVFSSDGKNFLSLCKSNELKLWDIISGNELQAFHDGSNEINAFTSSADGKYVLTGGKDNTLILWDKETGKEIRRFKE